MILVEWPVTAIVWFLSNLAITAAYCFFIAIHGLENVPRRLTSAFIYSCGIGHLGIAGFLIFLNHNYFAFLLITIWDMGTACASVIAAYHSWKLAKT